VDLTRCSGPDNNYARLVFQLRPGGAELIAEEIIAQVKKGSINRVFPAEFLNHALAESGELARAGDRQREKPLGSSQTPGSTKKCFQG
jgi:hypothetical protein